VAGRVEEFGGRWHVDSAPGRGTALHAWLPLRPTRPEVAEVSLKS
jgi:hypothetical protein